MIKSLTLGLLFLTSSISYADTNKITQAKCPCGQKASSKYHVKSKEYKVYTCSSKCKRVIKKNIENVVKKLKKSGAKLEEK